MSQERGKERAEIASRIEKAMEIERAMDGAKDFYGVGIEFRHADWRVILEALKAMAEPREWSDAAVEEAFKAYFYSDDMRAALQAADKAERERVQRG